MRRGGSRDHNTKPRARRPRRAATILTQRREQSTALWMSTAAHLYDPRRGPLRAQMLVLRSSQGALPLPRTHLGLALGIHAAQDAATQLLQSLWGQKSHCQFSKHEKGRRRRLVGTCMKHAGTVSGDPDRTAVVMFHSCLETWTQRSARLPTGFTVEAYRIPGPTAALNAVHFT